MEHANEAAHPAGGERFTWHPTYAGRTLREVRDELRTELARDQRAHRLAMEGAEEHEQQVLSTVIELEKKWSDFDLGWAEADPAELADRIAAFEWEREARQELFPFAEVRDAHAELVPPPAPTRPWWAFWRR